LASTITFSADAPVKQKIKIKIINMPLFMF